MTDRDLAALMGAGLPGVEVRHISSDASRRVMEAAVDERAVSLVASALDAGSLTVDDDEFRAELVAAHEAAMCRCVLLEQALLEVAAVLRRSGVDYRALKGPAVAHLDYPDAAWRTFGDVDLLVRSADYDRAVLALERWGARRRSHEVRAGFDRRFGKGVCLIGPDGVQVDLHRMLAGGPFGLAADNDALFDDPDAVVIGGESIPTLSRELRFFHACLHAVLGDWPSRLVPLRDVAQLRLATSVDVDATIRLAERWRSTIVIAQAIVLASTALHLPSDPAFEWATRYGGSRFERRSVAAYVGPGRSYARQMAAALPAVRGMGAKAAYVRALLLPDSEYVSRHDGGYLRRVRRAWVSRNSRGSAR